jgi:predicted transcriptional regulator
MMGILEHKGHLKKKAGERAYIYTPAKPQAQVTRGMVQEFVDRVFNGSRQPLLVHLMEEQGLSSAELDKIESLVRSHRKKS